MRRNKFKKTIKRNKAVKSIEYRRGVFRIKLNPDYFYNEKYDWIDCFSQNQVLEKLEKVEYKSFVTKKKTFFKSLFGTWRDEFWRRLNKV